LNTSVENLRSERELIVITKPEAGLRMRAEGLTSAEGVDMGSLEELLSAEGAKIFPLFGSNVERVRNEVTTLSDDTGAAVPDLSLYYRVQASDDRLDNLAEQLREQEVVEAAYVKPPAEPPIWQIEELARGPVSEEPPLHTPDFSSRQDYLGAAPGGINAKFAWRLRGGRGFNVGVIDIEGAWRFTHEDMIQNQGGVVGGTESSDIGWRNHGTAVAGEIGGDNNAFGIKGISSAANIRAISIFGGPGSAGAIRQAANMLNRGDIILIELHRPGPRFNFQSPQGQRGYIAIEWWPDDFDAIRYAASRGVIVVEAAGNGAENLDDNLYNTPAPGFPSNWTNPFNVANTQSGAIVVGAGAPPPGTHGRNHGPDRSRLDFSNYGQRLDTQGWGREVTTTGYGDLQGGLDENEWYTDTFSGTSSASPIIVGTIACLQGLLHGRRKTLLTPARVKDLLRNTGSLQQDAPSRPRSERIGSRPDLRQLIRRIFRPARSSTQAVSKKRKKSSPKHKKSSKKKK
jgi:subtilisin family serine protease